MAEARYSADGHPRRVRRRAGRQADEAWAFAVSWRLRRPTSSPTRWARASRRPSRFRATRESPQLLFGTPGEHADALQDRWVAEGRLVLADGETAGRDARAVRLGMSVA